MSTKASMAAQAVGSMRFQSEMRQFAGLMMVTGFCLLIQPLVDVAVLSGKDETVKDGIAFSNLFGDLCLLAIGLLSTFVGFLQLVHDWGHKYLTAFLILFIQTAWIPYITQMVDMGHNANNHVGFIPESFNPTNAQIRFVAAMGIMALMAYAFMFVGSVAFMAFAMFAFQAGKPEDRNSTYYGRRLAFYCMAFFFAGLTQLMLGSYVIRKFGGGDIGEYPVVVSMYVVNYPAMNIVIGAIQMLLAMWGFARGFGFATFGEKDHSFEACMFFSWFLQFVLQAVVQISYTRYDMTSALGPTVTTLMFATNLMPAFLDFKARTVPELVPEDFYGGGFHHGEEGPVEDTENPDHHSADHGEFVKEEEGNVKVERETA